MNATLAFCALIATGWTTPDMPQQPIVAAAQNAPAQNAPARAVASAQFIARHATRPAARAANNRASSRPQMPLSPTDPRLLADNNLPLPPTADDGTAAPKVDTRPHYVPSPNEANRRTAADNKPFGHYTPPSPVNPYMLLYSNTGNGTISTYNAYVRPALADRANRDAEEAAASQSTPVYPSVFLNQGSYYPSETVTR